MADTRFKPGQSGNLKGRPRRKSVRELVGEQRLAEVVKRMLEAAADGKDLPVAAVQAAKLLLPAQKPELPRVVVPALETATTHTAKAEAITAAVARGEISPDAAAALSTVVANMAKVVELDELVRRMAALEEKLNGSLA
jgi:hypothetical protein